MLRYTMYPIQLKECVGNFQRFQQLRSFCIFTAPLPESLHWFSFSLVSSQQFCIVWFFSSHIFLFCTFFEKGMGDFYFCPFQFVWWFFFVKYMCVYVYSDCTICVNCMFSNFLFLPRCCCRQNWFAGRIFCPGGRIPVNMFCKAPTGVMCPGTDYRQSDISAKEWTCQRNRYKSIFSRFFYHLSY